MKRPFAHRCRVSPPVSRSPAPAATSCSSKPPRCLGKGLVLTGQLGEVMKESARIALTYVKSHASALGIQSGALDGRELHVHVPAGAIPKDGPSAGVTMVTAIASLFTGRAVKSTIGMTGEVTLQGRVLPIGGLKQKVLAAHAAGLTEVIVPERNAADLDDVPREVREHMTFHIVGTVEEVLAAGAGAGSARHRGMRIARTSAADLRCTLGRGHYDQFHKCVGTGLQKGPRGTASKAIPWGHL